MDLKFKDYKYTRPDIEKDGSDVNNLLTEFSNTGNAEQQYEIILKINKVRDHLATMEKLVSIRYRVNTSDSFYEEEKNFFDANLPKFGSLVNKFYKLLLNSIYRKDLERILGEHIFNLAELKLRSFSDEIIDDLKKENELVTEYIKLTSSAMIFFEGEERNIAAMSYYMESTDREIRKNANKAKWKFFSDNEKEIDSLYDKLVKVRTGMARKLGYKNYTEMAYDRLKRTDYNSEDVNKFRESIEKYLVPLAVKIKEHQRKRLGLDKLRYYDQDYLFNSGNAFPKGSSEWITDKAAIMYSELSADTKEFFDFMTSRELFDLDNRKAKAGGGFCAFIPDYKSPFIFSNMNGTSRDVTVLTHEAGHAFQAYQSRNIELIEYISPTLEACEIHSMGMEFITWPWMNLFFEEDTAKFLFTHLTERILFIPYGVTVDEFQHRVYDNPDMTPDERRKVWQEIEQKYTPFKDYEDNDLLERGGWWMQQKHIFTSPFYYIDYCLAQVCAFQIWEKCNHDKDIVWKDYMNLCKSGGSKPFLELLKIAKLKSPFESKTVESVSEYCDNFVKNLTQDFK